jgi:hypothetical protein
MLVILMSQWELNPLLPLFLLAPCTLREILALRRREEPLESSSMSIAYS